jgi:N-acetylmuramoyl-L-alanine amidase
VGYPGAQSYPSPNFHTGRSAAVSHVVLHTTEGDLPSSLATLTDPFRSDSEGGRVSAHYLVAPSGTIYQLVDDSDTAWAAQAANPYSINIEVVGFAGSPATWTAPVIQSLGSLAGWLASEYGIPLVYREDPASPPLARGFVAHGALQPQDRSDPGPYFPWDEVRAAATPGAPALGSEISREWLGLVALALAAAALAWSLTK